MIADGVCYDCRPARTRCAPHRTRPGHLPPHLAIRPRPDPLFPLRRRARRGCTHTSRSCGSDGDEEDFEAQREEGRRRRSSLPVPPALLDTTLTNFLSITEPSYTSLLPPSTSPSTLKLPESAALSTWKSLYETATLQVLQHPTTKTLYAICAKFEDVPIRKLFETLCTVEKRIEWDGMCSGVEAIEAVEVGGRKGSVAWLGMKGVAVIKAKVSRRGLDEFDKILELIVNRTQDMVLLSVVGMLPPAAGAPAEKPGPLRLFCGTTSFLHPKYPVRSDYNRYALHHAVVSFITH